MVQSSSVTDVVCHRELIGVFGLYFSLVGAIVHNDEMIGNPAVEFHGLDQKIEEIVGVEVDDNY